MGDFHLTSQSSLAMGEATEKVRERELSLLEGVGALLASAHHKGGEKHRLLAFGRENRSEQSCGAHQYALGTLLSLKNKVQKRINFRRIEIGEATEAGFLLVERTRIVTAPRRNEYRVACRKIVDLVLEQKKSIATLADADFIAVVVVKLIKALAIRQGNRRLIEIERLLVWNGKRREAYRK